MDAVAGSLLRELETGERRLADLLGYRIAIGVIARHQPAIETDRVRFATKNGGSVTISPEEFIRRLLLHVLPGGFVKIRHYGLMASSNATSKLVVARRAIEADQAQAPKSDPIAAVATKDWRERYKELTGIDLSICPRCHQGRMSRYPLTQTDLAALRFSVDASLDTS